MINLSYLPPLETSEIHSLKAVLDKVVQESETKEFIWNAYRDHEVTDKVYLEAPGIIYKIVSEGESAFYSIYDKNLREDIEFKTFRELKKHINAFTLK